MVQPTVWLHYRPVRIGWIVTSGDLAEFQRAVRLSTCLWGGRYNPVVPTDDLDLAKNLVRTFEVDLLIPLRDTSATNRVIEAFPHLVAGMEGHAVFSAGEPRRCIYADVYHPVRRLHEDGSRTTEESRLKVIRPVWNPEDRLASLLTALFGDYPEPSTTGLDYREMLRTWVNAVDFRIGPDDAIDPLVARAARLWF